MFSQDSKLPISVSCIKVLHFSEHNDGQYSLWILSADWSCNI